MQPHTTCPVVCSRCNLPLIVEKRWLAGVKYERGVSDLDYRILATCQLRLATTFGSIFYFHHDQREFNEDCSEEFHGSDKKLIR